MDVNNPKVKTLILWGIVIVSFLIFWIAHIFVSDYQKFVEPKNYLLRAKYYFEKGDEEKAIKELKLGMETFRPVSSEALAFLLKIQKGKINKSNYNKLEKKYEVVSVIEKCPYSENISFDINILNTNEISFPPLSKTTKSGVTSLWKLSTRNALKCLQSVNLSEQKVLNFLYLSGGVFSFHSVIGETGYKIDDDVLVVSEGSEKGSGAQIWFQGRNFGGNRRGFYVLILTPPPSKIYRADRFDIWESYNESVKMTRFLEEVPEGYIGIFAVSDEASENMTDELEQMLISFGFAKKTYVRREKKLFGYGYAFAGIGVKGAQEGTAVQNWAEYNPSQPQIPIAVCAVLKGEGKL